MINERRLADFSRTIKSGVAFELLIEIKSVREEIIKNREFIMQAYIKHKKSSQCERGSGFPCGGCHFWQGAYSAISEILDEVGILPNDVKKMSDVVIDMEKGK